MSLPEPLQCLVERLEFLPEDVFTMILRGSALSMLGRAEDIDEDMIAAVRRPTRAALCLAQPAARRMGPAARRPAPWPSSPLRASA